MLLFGRFVPTISVIMRESLADAAELGKPKRVRRKLRTLQAQKLNDFSLSGGRHVQLLCMRAWHCDRNRSSRHAALWSGLKGDEDLGGGCAGKLCMENFSRASPRFAKLGEGLRNGPGSLRNAGRRLAGQSNAEGGARSGQTKGGKMGMANG